MATAPISDADTRNDYTATGGQTTFAYTFWIKEEDHLDVYQNGTLLTLTTDYTVSATQSVTGANVVLNSGATEGDTIAIVLNPDIERATEFATSGTFAATAMNLELTYLISLCQYLATQLSRKAGFADSVNTTGSLNIPTLSDNAGKVLAVASGETGVEWTTVASSTVVGNFESLVTDGDNSTTEFALGFTPVSVNSMIVEVDGVILEPTVDYTISSTNITFTTAPSTGTDNIVIRNLASGVAATTPADSSVTTAKVQNSAITTAKLADDAVTAAKLDIESAGTLTLATGDEFLVADVSDSDNVKKATIQNVLDLVAPDIFGEADTIITASDKLSFADASDSDNPKTDTVQGVLDLVFPDLMSKSSVTMTASDKIPYGDASDSDNPKVGTVQEILDLVTGVEWTYATEVATTSGTTQTIASGLSEPKEIEIFFDQVSSGTGNYEIVIGDSGGFETSGYVSVAEDGTTTPVTSTQGFIMEASASGSNYSGYMRIMLRDAGANEYVAHHMLHKEGTSLRSVGVGRKALSGDLTQIRIDSLTGNFDNGSVIVRYR